MFHPPNSMTATYINTPHSSNAARQFTSLLLLTIHLTLIDLTYTFAQRPLMAAFHPQHPFLFTPLSLSVRSQTAPGCRKPRGAAAGNKNRRRRVKRPNRRRFAAAACALTLGRLLVMYFQLWYRRSLVFIVW